VLVEHFQHSEIGGRSYDIEAISRDKVDKGAQHLENPEMIILDN